MKISYVLQLKDFFVMFCLGMLIGIIYGIINIPTRIKKNIVLQIINDLIISITTTVLFLLAINLINFGQFRTFLAIGYILGITIERITLGKLFAKGYKFVYTNIVKLLKKFANSKLGKVLLK
jgi:ABC-type phosphate/phosphonate transport system permease subunit